MLLHHCGWTGGCKSNLQATEAIAGCVMQMAQPSTEDVSSFFFVVVSLERHFCISRGPELVCNHLSESCATGGSDVMFHPRENHCVCCVFVSTAAATPSPPTHTHTQPDESEGGASGHCDAISSLSLFVFWIIIPTGDWSHFT